MSRPDIDAAVERMPSKLGVKKLLQQLENDLPPDEEVLDIVSGTYGDKPGIMVLTDRRILFISKWAFQSKSEEFLLDRISSVELKGGMLLAEISVYVSNQEAKITELSKAEAKRMVEQARTMVAKGSAPSPVSSPSPDAADQLLKLKQLLDAGILTSDEYETKRQQLISQL